MISGKIQDLGDWAEDAFSGLCSKSGVTRNKSSQDRSGWDYIIQFPAKRIDQLPSDMQPGEKSARVQVKSKGRGKPSIPLSLSNAVRFAKEPMPCFVVLFLATDKAEPVRFYAKHFWVDEIARTLKRVRRADADGKTDFHKMIFSISFTDADAHDDDLLEWMRRTSEQFGENYGAEKLRIQQQAGFEDGMIHGTISFQAKDLSAIIDHQIGLRPTAPLERITLKNRRFGVDAPLPFLDFKPDYVHMQPVPLAARIRVRTARTGDLWLDGKHYLPAFPNLPIESRKMRIATDFLEIVIAGDRTGTVNLKFDQERKLSLTKIDEMLYLTNAALDGSLDIEIRTDGYPNLPITVSLPADASRDGLNQLSNVVKCLQIVAYGVEPAELALSVDEIDQSWNAIVNFNGLVAGTDMSGKFELIEIPPQESRAAQSISFYGYVDIGSWTFMAVVRRPITEYVMEEKSGRFLTGEPKVVEALIRPGKGVDYLAELQSLYESATKNDKIDGSLEMFAGDYLALLNADNIGNVSIQQKRS